MGLSESEQCALDRREMADLSRAVMPLISDTSQRRDQYGSSATDLSNHSGTNMDVAIIPSSRSKDAFIGQQQPPADHDDLDREELEHIDLIDPDAIDAPRGAVRESLRSSSKYSGDPVPVSTIEPLSEAPQESNTTSASPQPETPKNSFGTSKLPGFLSPDAID